MSWSRVAAIWALLAVLGIFVRVVDRVESEPGGEDTDVPVGPSLLEASAAAVTTITFRQDGKIVRLTRRNGTWQTLEPPGVRISPDLVEATVATLTTGQVAERLGSEPEQGLVAYGLETPTATLDIVVGPAPTLPVRVMLGARNPTQTAVYARRDDRPAIYLVGMNLRYYVDLIFEAAAAR